jgi:hypothetical protein
MTASSGGRKARNPWVQIAPGVRSRKILESPAATSRRIERNIQRDTLGLGHWSQPENWCKEPFSHTVTTVADITGQRDGWHIYNSGVVVTLAVQPLEGPFVRGVPYVWCKRAREIGGGSGEHPTAPIFGRFLSQTKRGPKALVGKAQSKVLGAEYVYCFRAVGRAGFDSDLFQRSEIPLAIPSELERQKQPAEFDVLQHAAKALDLTLCNMADVVDMTDELDDAAKKAGGDDADMRAHRQARAYRVLDTIVTAALRQSGTVETQLADFLETSPKLARYLARWQADNP